MKDATILGLSGLAALTIIEVVALQKGVDSVILGAVVAVIGGVAGYEVRKRREK